MDWKKWGSPEPAKKGRVTVLKGIGISPGIDMGRAVIIERFALCYQEAQIDSAEIEVELSRFEKARAESEQQIDEIVRSFDIACEKDKYDIFESHYQIVRDPVFIHKIRTLVKEKQIRSESAVNEVAEEFAAKLECMNDEMFKTRAGDIRDVGSRIVKNILGLPADKFIHLSEPSVIVAKDLSPSEIAALDRKKIKAFAIGSGGKTSHVAIMARCMGIPAVGGLGLDLSLIEEQDFVIVDGDRGEVIPHPDEAVSQEYLSRREAILSEQKELERFRTLPAVTGDIKRRVEVSANIGFLEDCGDIEKFGADGVGLYRTEFLFMDQKCWPDEETQYREYKRIVEKVAPLPMIIRTLDIGGDKNLAYMEIPHEENPFLGLRALRLCFDRPEVFRAQLRALLRASVFGNVKIMFPMVSSLEEVRKAKAFLEAAKNELRAEGIPYAENIEVGIMIEIPAAAVIADLLIQEVDFFSIGTNDLIQYTVAADRMNRHVANLYDPFNPAVLRLIKHVIDVSHQNGKWTGMCGEMAGMPEAAALLVGMGLDEFSMAAISIPGFKRKLAGFTYEDAVTAAEKALRLDSAEEIRQMLLRDK